MIASFFVSLREGLEAGFIIGVLPGALNKLDRTNYQTPIWLGTGLVFSFSIILGFEFNL